MRKKTWLSWSSGKDSAWALHVLRQSGDTRWPGLFTTINAAFERVAMHAVRVELLRQQAQAVDLLIGCSMMATRTEVSPGAEEASSSAVEFTERTDFCEYSCA